MGAVRNSKLAIPGGAGHSQPTDSSEAGKKNIGDWNAKVGSQEIPGVTGKFGLEYRMQQGKG